MNTKSFFLLILIASLGCSDTNSKNKQKELELKEREIKLKEQELQEKTVETKLEPVKKYVFIKIEAKEPSLYHHDEVNEPELRGSIFQGTYIPEVTKVYFNKYIYPSDILEIENYTEDERFKSMDEFERNVLKTLAKTDINFQNEVFYKVKIAKEVYMKYHSEIIKRNSWVFNSYKEASEYRNQNKNTLW